MGNYDYIKPLRVACYDDNYEEVERLLQAGTYSGGQIKREVELIGWRVSSAPLAELLVRHGASMKKNWGRDTVLHWACLSRIFASIIGVLYQTCGFGY